MPSLKDKIKTDSLHHAYLLEGEREKLVSEIISLLRDLNIETDSNPDFVEITLDTLRVDDARHLKSLTQEKGVSEGKKVYLLTVNSILLEAQNTLLKIFEEPIADTHFFIVVPDASSLIPTFVSRFYLIEREVNESVSKEAEKFISLPIASRIEYIKELIAVEDEDDPSEDSARTKAIKFLNEVESVLHGKMDKTKDNNHFNQIFKVREFLRMPGSSPKTLMESVALVIPKI